MRDNLPRGGGSRFLYEPFQRTPHDGEMQAYLEILRSLGTPDQLREKLEIFNKLVEDQRRREWIFHSIKAVAAWATVVAAGWMGFKGLIVEILAGFIK